MHVITFLDRSTIPDGINLKRPLFEHRWQEYPLTSHEQVVSRLLDSSIVITNKVALSKETLEALPNLKMIAVAATGYNHIDLDFCREKNITVSNIQNYAKHSVPEHALTLLLALRRNLLAYTNSVRSGEWQESQHFCLYEHKLTDLHNSRLGIVGGGDLGKAFANLAEVLGMKVFYADRKGQVASGRKSYLPFEELIQTSDVVSLHCPLTPETENIISLPEMETMKRTAVLLNTARGGLVNEEDLVYAINNGLIAGAGFDVASVEPILPDNPLLSLHEKNNFILTSHVAWASDTALQTLADQLIDNIDSFVAGVPAHQIV